jgi:hypothetical protein
MIKVEEMKDVNPLAPNDVCVYIYKYIYTYIYVVPHS